MTMFAELFSFLMEVRYALFAIPHSAMLPAFVRLLYGYQSEWRHKLSISVFLHVIFNSNMIYYHVHRLLITAFLHTCFS